MTYYDLSFFNNSYIPFYMMRFFIPLRVAAEISQTISPQQMFKICEHLNEYGPYYCSMAELCSHVLCFSYSLTFKGERFFMNKNLKNNGNDQIEIERSFERHPKTIKELSTFLKKDPDLDSFLKKDPELDSFLKVDPDLGYFDELVKNNEKLIEESLKPFFQEQERKRRESEKKVDKIDNQTIEKDLELVSPEEEQKQRATEKQVHVCVSPGGQPLSLPKISVLPSTLCFYHTVVSLFFVLLFLSSFLYFFRIFKENKKLKRENKKLLKKIFDHNL